MKLDLRAMLADELRVLPIDYEIVPDTNPDDPYSTLYDVRFPSPMRVNGEIVNTAGYMKMTLNLSLDFKTSCARCLREVAGKFTFSLEKTVAPRNLLEGLDEDTLDDYAIVEDGFLDMDEQLLELLELEFPRRVLCKEDCRGLCQRCGKDLNLGPCDCKKEIDPRLQGFAKILEDMNQQKQ